jgi:hypothetical protein
VNESKISGTTGSQGLKEIEAGTKLSRPVASKGFSDLSRLGPGARQHGRVADAQIKKVIAIVTKFLFFICDGIY